MTKPISARTNKPITELMAEALAFHNAGRLGEAAQHYAAILKIDKSNTTALTLLGSLHAQRGDFEEAIQLIELSLKINRRQPVALVNIGAALSALDRHAEALTNYEKAILLKPDFADAYNNRGSALRKLKRHREALENFEKAIALKPNFSAAHHSRGNVLRDFKRYDEALASYDQAIALKPDFAEAYDHRGSALRDLGRYPEALASYEKAIALQPDFATAYNNRGSSLEQLGRYAEALENYEKAILLKPDFAQAHSNRGNVLRYFARHEEAAASFGRAVELDAGLGRAHGGRLLAKMTICRWDGFREAVDEVLAAIELGSVIFDPFSVITIPSTPYLQRKCVELYVKEKFPPSLAPIQRPERYEHDRVRLGYFSADFHNHPVSYLMAELFERHDRAKFEVTAFSFGPPIRDAMRARLEKSFDRFIEVGALSDKDVALLARELEIDIAVDLMGFTQNSRPGIFALRAAPVQVNYLGYPATMGAPYIDYMIADKIVIPWGQEVSYKERIVYLPHSYLPTDSTRAIAERTPTRAEAGLPDEGFVFCCFNNSYKLTPDIFTIWISLLANVEGGVLWLGQANPSAMRNLRRQAELKGVAGNRICFAPFVREPDEHLARLRLADLFLDTLPYNAHATASDALWVGLPVLTCLGQTFAGRVAASLLDAVGLPELITQDLAQYEALALELARDPQRLRSLREKLAANRSTQPLFDTALFTRHIESAYASMWQRHQAGLEPEHIHVQP